MLRVRYPPPHTHRLTLAVQSAISPELPAFVLAKARELLPQDKLRKFVFHRDLLGHGVLGNAAAWLNPRFTNPDGPLNTRLYSRVRPRSLPYDPNPSDTLAHFPFPRA